MLVTLRLFAPVLNAQILAQVDLTTIGRDPQWKIFNRTAAVVEIRGKRGVSLNEGDGMGVAWYTGIDFVNGVIEVDLLGRSQPIQGSFVGIAFRVVDAKTHDAIYFRPFNFRVVDPERHSHAVQYASHPKWPWQVLRANYPGEYERAIAPELDGDEWFHVRVIVERSRVSVTVNGASTPCLVVDELSNRVHGAVGVWVGEGSGGSFANLRVLRYQ